jgi:MFS family permease
MIWTIVGSIVASIVISILWGIFAGMLNPDEEHRADRRDREIEWQGDRVGQALLVIGSLGALILAMVEAEWFWIGNAIFLGFFASAFLGGIARIVIYRRGMP